MPKKIQYLGKILILSSFLLLQLTIGSEMGNISQISTEQISPSNSGSFQTSNVEISSTFMSWEPPSNLIWCGDVDESIIALSSNKRPYISSDRGKTWRELLLIRNKDDNNETNDKLEIFRMIQSPADKQVIIFQTYFGSSDWITGDCGKNVTPFIIGKELALPIFNFHPTERNWLLASPQSCKNYLHRPCPSQYRLYVSKDLGATWTFLAKNVEKFSWGFRGGDFSINIPVERVVISCYLDEDSTTRLDVSNKEIIYSDDYFKTNTSVLKPGFYFLLDQNYFIAYQRVKRDYRKNLYIGTNAHHYDLELEPFQENVIAKDYHVVGVIEERIFLEITEVNSALGLVLRNIYVSDSTGRRFTRSTRDYLYGKIVELGEVLLMNVYDHQAIAKLDDSLRHIPLDKELMKYKITQISFNNGGTWQTLLPPKVNSKGKEIECRKEDDCALHLHESFVWEYKCGYNLKRSLSIVLGVGNVGKYLSHKRAELNTYLSRDGGLTWNEVLQGSHIYEIGNYGAIIVAAPHREDTTNLLYTLDQGLTWHTLEISKVPIQVKDIVIEPTNTTLRFFVLGYILEFVKEPGIIIAVDFETLNIRTCQDPFHPDTPGSDYEKWSPRGSISSSCIMGHQTTYIRRKREAHCFENLEFDRLYSYTDCECTEEDWECDAGNERTKEGFCSRIYTDTQSGKESYIDRSADVAFMCEIRDSYKIHPKKN